MKSFVIYNPNDSLSRRLVEESIESCHKYDIYPERFSGIFGNEANQLKNDYKLQNSIHSPDLKLGDIGCFLSHFLLWNKCVEIDEPILILEHDITMIREMPDNILNEFSELLNLDLCGSLRKQYNEYIECMKKEGKVKVRRLFEKNQIPQELTWKSAKTYHVAGAHAYIIKPNGAQKLISSAKKNGILPADVHINSHYVDIHVCEPSIIRTCDFMIDKKNRVKYSSTKGYLYGKS